MSLICMAVFDTVENKRTELTKQTLDSLCDTVNFDKHRIIIIDNDSCGDTKYWLRTYKEFTNFQIITLSENVGTSRAINLALAQRQPCEHAIKIDNDVVIHQSGWVEQMEQAIAADPQIGIIGLKRKDIMQTPWHPDPNFRSELIMLPHNNGERWQVIERTADIIGTCTMYNSALIDKVGYSKQVNHYGYDDVLYCHRSHLAGFYNCFLPHIEIDHIDPGNTPYQHWKEKVSGEDTAAMIELFKSYVDGTRPIYEPFY